MPFPTPQEIHEKVNGDSGYFFWVVDFRNGRTVVRAETDKGAIKALQKEHGRTGGPYRVIDPAKMMAWPNVMEELGHTWFDSTRERHMGIWSLFATDGAEDYDPPFSVTKNFPKCGWKVGIVWPRSWQTVLPPERGGVNLQYHEHQTKFDAIVDQLIETEKRKCHDIYMD